MNSVAHGLKPITLGAAHHGLLDARVISIQPMTLGFVSAPREAPLTQSPETLPHRGKWPDRSSCG